MLWITGPYLSIQISMFEYQGWIIPEYLQDYFELITLGVNGKTDRSTVGEMFNTIDYKCKYEPTAIENKNIKPPLSFIHILKDSMKLLNESTDIYEFGKTLNKNFTYQDKIDFIRCTFEVAFIDKKMHYLEEHTIKKISSILNVEHDDLINSKKEIKQFLNLK